MLQFVWNSFGWIWDEIKFFWPYIFTYVVIEVVLDLLKQMNYKRRIVIVVIVIISAAYYWANKYASLL